MLSYTPNVNAESAHIPAQRSIEAPAGFAPACSRYAFLCGVRPGRAMSDQEMLSLAETINLDANGRVRSVTDAANYGRQEHWSLPDNGAGDCEDYALLKKKMLIESGVDSRRLTMAVVLDRTAGVHSVLVLRLDSGDVVLDNLTDRIHAWDRSGLTFVARQNASDKRSWRASIAGPQAERFAGAQSGAMLRSASGSGGRD
ncbi:MAG: transglutaminase-like cysteine peptidase [Microvirga sp.]|nr:transglutaminase-like cysteine peptidase [Microvirga sp.]